MATAIRRGSFPGSTLPLARRKGKVADEAMARARVDLSRALGDVDDECRSALKLAGMLGERDVELDVAIELVRGARMYGDDSSVRHALAGWLENLGEPALAASELRPLTHEREARTPKQAASLLVRIGVLLARAGDAVGAQRKLAEAVALDEANALALELLAVISGLSHNESESGAARWAESYVGAARRRALGGDAEAELENLRRAFELDPSLSLAATSLSTAFVVRERTGAADEVLRHHARALDGAGRSDAAIRVHEQRRMAAMARGDGAGALAAALDEGLDAVFAGPNADAIDDLLVKAGALEPFAFRSEIRAESERGPRAARAWAQIGRLHSGLLAAPERAVRAYARAVSADATNEDNLAALRGLATYGDEDWVLEALIRATLGDTSCGGSSEARSRLAGASALAKYAEEHSDEPLAAFAQVALCEIDSGSERARDYAARAAEIVKQHDEQIAEALSRLNAASAMGASDSDGASRTARTESLGVLVHLLRSAPGQSKLLATSLAELAEQRPHDERLVLEALRVAERVFDVDTASRIVRAVLAAGTPSLRVRLACVSALVGATPHRAPTRGAPTTDKTHSFVGAYGHTSLLVRSLLDDGTWWSCSVAWITSAMVGDRATRARAMAAYAPLLCGGAFASVRGALSAIAAEELLRVGEQTDQSRARAVAEQAVQANPTDARALAVLSLLVSASEGRVAQVMIAVLERAVAVLGPTSSVCRRLAQIYEQRSDWSAALAWTCRLLALYPSDANIFDVLFERAKMAGNVEALSTILSWLIHQPEPASFAAERIGPALVELALRDPSRAVEIAARALDVLGPRNAICRAAIGRVATLANAPHLLATLTERWIASGVPAAERGSLLITLAHNYRAAGDVGRELSACVRAARAHADLTSLRDRIEELAKYNKTPDEELAWLEVRAELAIDECRADMAALSLRELGAALWDMADDRPRAISMWFRAAEFDLFGGYRTLRKDLSAFADAKYAADCLEEVTFRERDRIRSGLVAHEASCAALDAGELSRALRLAKMALDRHPGCAEALEVAEQASRSLGRVQEMTALYDHVAHGSCGRFGRRAAHQRAARYFEGTGIPMLALKHATQAFLAAPSEGSTLGLLERTADRAHRRSVAVRTIEHVADLECSHGARAGWLLRAAAVAPRDLEGNRQRFDVLVKAMVLAPTLAIAAELASVARELAKLGPDNSDAVALRLERASEALAKRLEGPDGARIAIAFARIALDVFGNAPWAWRTLEQANSVDADVDEYASLMQFVPELARVEGAAGALARMMATCDTPYVNVGLALLMLVGAIAKELGDATLRARALVMAAEKESADDDIVSEADDAAVASSDLSLAARLSTKISASRRSEALRARAVKLADAGEHAAAVAKLERAYEIAPSDVDADVAIEALLIACGGYDELAKHLARRADRLSADANADARRAVRFRRTAILEQRLGRLDEAAAELERLLAESPGNPSALGWLSDLRERLGQPAASVPLLDALVATTTEPTDRLVLEVRRVRALLASGQAASARDAVRELADRAPSSRLVLELRVEIARAEDDTAELCAALPLLASLSPGDAQIQSDMLVEAAQAAIRLGDNEAALECGREAADLVPDVESTQQFLRELEARFPRLT
ncbi:MAG: hypothetical protein FWD73_06370 [Polyangiaceae bacterium]|nr:hypothetical protein [Polyangiaceae bacterium]